MLVIAAIAINAAGNMIPPTFVFPIKNYRGYFIANCPSGYIDSVIEYNWTNSSDLLKFLEHFARHTQPQKDQYYYC